MNTRTSINVHEETRRKLIQIGGSMEWKNGEKRTIEDTIKALILYFEKTQEKPIHA